MSAPAPQRTLSGAMCFGAFVHSAECELCGRHRPDGLAERCAALRSEAEAEQLDDELRRYLDTAEARFFAWLARPAG